MTVVISEYVENSIKFMPINFPVDIIIGSRNANLQCPSVYHVFLHEDKVSFRGTPTLKVREMEQMV